MELPPNEKPNELINKFELMLKTDDVYFFDSEDFEEIIHYYLNQGKVALGKKAIDIGLQQYPNSTELKLLYVEVLVFENHFSEAEAILDELHEIDDSNDEIYIQRANILSKKDDHQGAVELLLQALETTDDSFEIYSLMGMEHLFLDHFDAAKQCFIKCLENDPSDYASLYNIVYCFEFLKDFDGAIEYLNTYLEYHPYSEVGWHQLGMMYHAKNMHTEALAAFDFAIISDDSFIGAYFEKGKILEKLGKLNEAIACYETTISMDDPTAHAYLRIGKCHEKLGNDDFAKHHYFKAVHEDPQLDKGWLAIADFYYRLKDFKEASIYINKALNIDGENPTYWKKSGEIFQVLKNYHEADFSYKQAIELGNYEIDTWQNWAFTLSKLHDFESATQVLMQGIEFYPDNTQLLFQLAGMHLKNKNKICAKQILDQLLPLSPSNAMLFLKLYPEFATTKWVQDCIKASKKASI